MSHDLTAEYDAYLREFGTIADDPDRADAIRAELARVRSGIEAQAAAKIVEAENHENEGRDLFAARARIRARELRQHLETTAASLPLETVTPPRKRGLDATR